MSASDPVKRFFEIRAAWPLDVAADGGAYLIACDAPGTAQVYRLDALGRGDESAYARAVGDGGIVGEGSRSKPRGAEPGAAESGHRPAAPEEMARVTAFAEPAWASYIPGGPSAGGRAILLSTDCGGNERHQLYLAHDDPAPPLGGEGGGDDRAAPLAGDDRAAPLAGDDRAAPLAADDRYIHRPGGIARDGSRVAFGTNRRDGIAFDAWVRELSSGAEAMVFSSGGWAEPAGFSPDGRYLAIVEQTPRAGDNRLHLVDRAANGERAAAPGGAGVVELAPHPEASASVGPPCWLPGGEAFFFATSAGRDAVGIARGAPDGSWDYVFEPGWDAQCGVDWAGRYLLATWNEGGISRVELRDAESLARIARVPLPAEGVASSFRFSPAGDALLFAFSAPRRPWEAWRYRPGDERLEQLTESSPALDRDRFAPAEPVAFAAADGLSIPAFLFVPPRARGPSPVVVIVHGGPESQWRPSFSPLAQLLIDQGFAVIAPNVRGSTGYGRRYQHLDDRDRRWDAIRDLEAVHDFIAGDPRLDAGRAILYGGSYGGYMTLAGLAFQPERWAGGVDVVGMSSLVTFLENTSPWRRPFREREYGSLSRDRELLEALSPIHRAHAMRAPLCIVHGKNDPRVPLGEAEQIHAALCGRGVRCDLRVYPDEGHGLAKLKNRLDAYRHILGFLRDVARP